LNDKWSAFAEAQLRSLKLYDHFHYYEYKGGLNYTVHPNLTLTLGAGSYQTYGQAAILFYPKAMMSSGFGRKLFFLTP
jgi:hypothetical protein